MQIKVSKKRLKLYMWIALAFMLLWITGDLVTYPATFWERVINNVWRMIYLTVLNIFLFEYSIPFIVKKRSYLFYNIVIGILIIWIHMMLYSFGAYAWRQFGVHIHIYSDLFISKVKGDIISSIMGYSMGSVFFFGIVRHIYDHIKLTQSAQKLRIEKQQAELSYLKSQTNPHFLFNTLNNIYSLSRSKSDLAPESILRLSKILRYMLYETSGDYIAIEQELKIMADYIDLEKLRYDESLKVNFSHNIEDMKQSIPPLLLIPLVENAFKHGVSETRGNPSVDIHLSVNNRQLLFRVKNSIDASSEAEVVRENIGLSNLRRQLELLYSDYHLSVKPEGAFFIATLKINLSSHV